MEGKNISWGDVHMGRCTLTHCGLNNTISPFLKKDLPNFEFDVEGSDLTEEAFKILYGTAMSKWIQTPYEDDISIFKYYGYAMKPYGFFGVCAARGCIRACMDNLEKNKRIKNLFNNPFYRKKSWRLPNKKKERIGKLNPWRERWLDNNYPSLMEGE